MPITIDVMPNLAGLSLIMRAQVIVAAGGQ